MIGAGSWIRLCFLKLSLRICLERPAPIDQVPIHVSSYFAAYVRKDGVDCFNVLVRDVDVNGISGLQHDQQTYSLQRSIENRSLKGSSLRVVHAFRGGTIEYSTVRGFIWGRVSARAWRLRVGEFIAQALFNVTTRFRHDRISILKRLIDLHISDSAARNGALGGVRGRGVMDMFHELYSSRAFGHPEFNPEYTKSKLIVSSLVDSRDLVETEGEIEPIYEIGPCALETVARYELQERRHRVGVFQNWLIVFLTFVIAVATGAGVYYHR